MAKYTLAEVCEKLLAVKAGLDAGRTAAVACKAAGLSPGTYKKWLTTYAHLDLPSWVVAAPFRGAIALSGDGRHVFSIADEPTGFAFVRYDAASGAESAKLFLPAPRGSSAWREVLAATADESGARVCVILSGGAMLTWDVARNSVAPIARDLRSGCVALEGRAGTSGHRWCFATISPDLARLAYWESAGDRDTGASARLVVREIESGAEVLRHETAAQFISSELVFHPTRSLLGFLGENSLITVLDLDARKALIESGPQAHRLSFGPDALVLYDDWYSRTQALDLTTGESRALGRGGGVTATQRDRFVTVSETAVVIHSARDASATRELKLEKIVEARLSPDGACLAVLADRLCVWNLGESER